MKAWASAKPQLELQRELSEALQIHPITAQLLTNRGILNPQAAAVFLRPELKHLPDPLLFIDMDKAVGRITRALQDKEQIAIYGDYDVDGITSTALLAKFLRTVGHEAILFIPHRIRDGYGMTSPGVKQLAEQGAKLIVTVDNGSHAHDAIHTADELGIDVVVTDHHEMGELPPACAVVNPKRPGSAPAFEVLAGCGVVFFLIMALRRHLREKGLLPKEPVLRPLLALAAIGTIADSVPLIGINRILASVGLTELLRTENVGLRALMRLAKLPDDRLQSWHISFGIAPRLNAAGRIAEPALALELLLTDDSSRGSTLAEQLNTLNTERQSLQEQVLQEALIQAEVQRLSGATVVYHPSWEPGVIGIVAAKLVETFGQPAVVISGKDKTLKGSVRSIPQLNIVECLKECADHLTQFGGHAQAAGVSITANFVDPFRQRLAEVCAEKMKDIPRSHMKIDAITPFSDISETLIHELHLLEPFGIGNPEPLFATHDIEITDSRIVGENHFKFMAKEGRNRLDAIAFRQAEKFTGLSSCRVAFRPELNHYNGVTRMQLKIVDLLKG
ncbi:MAG: single-stranded-DNA-specific exonuclease RecJ [Deltaproteobacteria bacterium]|nr:single-stranded-DNA-specific exonuclease RecJ [Deltaproteobacteria bacterium]